MKLSVLVTLALATLSYVQASFVLKEKVPEPTQWIKRGPAPDTQMLRLNFGLKQRGLNELETTLLDVSNPSSANYGKYLTQSQVNNLLQPAENAIPSVRRWLSEHGVEEDIAKRSAAGDWLTASLTVAQARSLLGDAQFNIYEHRSTGEQLIRTTEYSVPRDVSDHIDLVSPTTYFRQVRSLTQHKTIVDFEPLSEPFQGLASMQKVSANKISSNDAQATAAGQPTSCNATRVTAQCLRDYYQISNYTPKSPNKQLIGISGFLNQFATYDDLQNYLVKERPDAAKAGYKFTTVELAGSVNDQSQAGVEANLDVQTIAGLAFPIPSTFYSVKGSPPYKPDDATPTNTNEPYSTEFQYLLQLSDDKLPSVLSTSYGDDEQTVPVSYQYRVCYEAAALGLRGTTVFFSSGDNGVGADGECYSNDGKNKYQFLPAFPASCPFVTTVGATQNFSPERAVLPYASGGGFSNVWPQPDYQKEVVQAYVKSLNGQYKGLYNPNGRAYPDLSAQGLDFVISLNGTFGRVSGTSASCPATASIFSLLNDKRISEGKPKLGFLNPALYAGAGAKGLHDITIGSSFGCNTTGFPAKEGWDAVTGFGTPRFAALSAVLG